jgi:plastocyanin
MGTPANRNPIWVLPIAAVASTLMLAACGGGSGSNTATPTMAVQATAPAAPSATPPTLESKTETPVAATTPTPAPPPRSPEPSHVPVATPTPVAVPATAPPPPPTQAPPPPPTGHTESIVAKDTKFSVTSFTVTAGGPVTIKLDNQDVGVQHDIVVLDPAGTQVAATDVATGPVMQQTSFTPAAPGRYTFKCTVHPQQMYGVIVVQ